MHRRQFLTLTAGLTGMAVVGATGCAPGLHSPNDAPTPDGYPTTFADSTAWPGGRTKVEVTAVRDRYLTAMAPVADAEGTFTEALTAVVVDVTGPTNWALLLKGDGTWTTKQVTLRDEKPQREDKALTSIVRGPAVLDDTHAYLVVGLFPLEPGQFTGRPESVHSHRLCPVMLFKIRLSDGVLVASTTVSDALKVGRLQHAALSLSTDGRSLLLAADPDTDNPATDGWIGLRLSTDDLSVEFDARTLYVGTRLTSVSTAGQGIVVAFESYHGRELVLLADGRRLAVAQREPMVLSGWVHQVTVPPQGGELALVAFNIDSGERVTMKDPTAGLPQWPTISSPYPPVIQLGSGTPFRVWVPGSPASPHDMGGTPARSTPEGAAMCGDILYTWLESRLTLQRLGARETLADLRIPPDRLSPGVGVVTPWGLATPNQFFRATEWSKG